MDSFARNETQALIEKSIGRFVAERCEFSRRRARLQHSPVDYLSLWPEYVELGLLTLPFHEDVGGSSGRSDDIAVAISALGAGLPLEPFIEVAVIAGFMLECLPSEHRDKDIRALMAGDKLVVLADGRPGYGVGVTFRRLSDGCVLSGLVPAVAFASQAHEWLLVATEVTDGSTAIFRVQSGLPGITVRPFRLLDGRPASDIVLNECTLATDAVLAVSQTAENAVEGALRRGGLAYCMEAVAIMGALVSGTGEYLRTRVQFGAPLATFQALQHRFADMYMSYKESFAVMLHCVEQMCGSDDNEQTRAIIASRIVIGEASRLIGHEAIQMHGGVGATDELPISHFNSRLVVIQRTLQGREDARKRLAVFAGAGA